jgi:UDP-N-acetylglucosamine--N-acetylmuramyl-(pentapeptide) pyrophosphoryl-undecaprenol N-acetylglucosamine transferase
MAGGGTGGHVIPSLAVAAELRRLGHDALFVGTRRGMEATLVPRAGFRLEWIDIGGLQRVGLVKTIRSLAQLPVSVLKSLAILRRHHAQAVFSMGGYVAAPVMLAAILNRTPMIVMEPNALPGLVSRKLAGYVRRALVNFEETRKYFPAGRTEVTGLPVRQEFFQIPERPAGGVFQVLITGGSRGSRALNQAARDSWPMFRDSAMNVRIVLQCGADEHHELVRRFNETGLDGEVVPFIHDMPAAYAQADLVVSRSGAGAISELAAAGKPSLLIPFPFAADDHQRHNAQALQQAGAARMILERDWNGTSLFEQVRELQKSPEKMREMARAARAQAKTGAAQRACSILIELGKGETSTRS